MINRFVKWIHRLSPFWKHLRRWIGRQTLAFDQHGSTFDLFHFRNSKMRYWDWNFDQVSLKDLQINVRVKEYYVKKQWEELKLCEILWGSTFQIKTPTNAVNSITRTSQKKSHRRRNNFIPFIFINFTEWNTSYSSQKWYVQIVNDSLLQRFRY